MKPLKPFNPPSEPSKRLEGSYAPAKFEGSQVRGVRGTPPPFERLCVVGGVGGVGGVRGVRRVGRVEGVGGVGWVGGVGGLGVNTKFF